MSELLDLRLPAGQKLGVGLREDRMWREEGAPHKTSPAVLGLVASRGT